MKNENTISLTTFITDETFIARHIEDIPMRYRSLMADGSSISIQASRKHRCYPQSNQPRRKGTPYFSLELGYPSSGLQELIQELREYADTQAPNKKDVFGFVPWTKVEELIANHGGIVGVEIPKKLDQRTVIRKK